MSDTWNRLLLSEPYLKIGKSVFRDEISKDQEKLKNAAENGITTEVKKLLSSGMLDINRGHGFSLITPLHKAAEKGHMDVVQALIDRGADVNKPCKVGNTPLHEAALQGHKAVVKLLLERGAEVNKQGMYGWTPLHCAAANNHKEMVKILLEGGAMPEITDEAGRTPLNVAHQYGRTEVTTILTNHNM